MISKLVINSEVVVLIPHYNNLSGLYKSLTSISEDIPIDVLIVDDGSYEKPLLSYLEGNFNKLNKIHLIMLENNVGIENALNAGLHFIINDGKYKFIARLDAGDTCIPNRLFLQYSYLMKNPDIYLLGTWAFCTDKYGKVLYQFKHALDDDTIKRNMHFKNEFVHSSVIYKLEAVNTIGLYPTNYKYAEDYAYFLKFVKRFKVANLPIPLVNYEVSPDGLSIKNRRLQVKSRIAVILYNYDFSVLMVLGLLYNIILYVIPTTLLQAIKRLSNNYLKNAKVD